MLTDWKCSQDPGHTNSSTAESYTIKELKRVFTSAWVTIKVTAILISKCHSGQNERHIVIKSDYEWYTT